MHTSLDSGRKEGREKGRRFIWIAQGYTQEKLGLEALILTRPLAHSSVETLLISLYLKEYSRAVIT